MCLQLYREQKIRQKRLNSSATKIDYAYKYVNYNNYKEKGGEYREENIYLTFI